MPVGAALVAARTDHPQAVRDATRATTRGRPYRPRETLLTVEMAASQER